MPVVEVEAPLPEVEVDSAQPVVEVQVNYREHAQSSLLYSGNVKLMHAIFSIIL